MCARVRVCMCVCLRPQEVVALLFFEINLSFTLSTNNTYNAMRTITNDILQRHVSCVRVSQVSFKMLTGSAKCQGIGGSFCDNYLIVPSVGLVFLVVL